MDLISIETALTGLAGITTSQQSNVPALISAASEITERWCNRRFSVSTYDELYNGDGSGVLILRNFPVISIDRLGSGIDTAITITNTNTTNYRSTVAVDNSGIGGTESNPTGIVLTRWYAGGIATNHLDFSDHPSFAELATGVNDLGEGWTATTPVRYASWACTELRPVQGSYGSTSNTAKLRVYSRDLNDFSINQNTGELRIGSDAFSQSLYFLESSPIYSMQINGFNSFRVVYRAGFETIPYGVQQAVVLIVQSLFQSLLASSVYTREKLFDYEYEIGKILKYGIPLQAQNLLSLYKDFRASGEY